MKSLNDKARKKRKGRKRPTQAESKKKEIIVTRLNKREMDGRTNRLTNILNKGRTTMNDSDGRTEKETNRTGHRESSHPADMQFMLMAAILGWSAVVR